MRRPVAPGRRCWGNKEGTITVIEHHDQKQSGGGGEGGLTLSHTSKKQFLT